MSGHCKRCWQENPVAGWSVTAGSCPASKREALVEIGRSGKADLQRRPQPACCVGVGAWQPEAAKLIWGFLKVVLWVAGAKEPSQCACHTAFWYGGIVLERLAWKNHTQEDESVRKHRICGAVWWSFREGKSLMEAGFQVLTMPNQTSLRWANKKKKVLQQ